MPVLLLVAVLMYATGSIEPRVVFSQQQEDEALPESSVVIDIDAPEQSVYRIGIPALVGAGAENDVVAEVLRNDFRLMPGYRVIDPRSTQAITVPPDLRLQAGAWAAQQANGVIQGTARTTGSAVEVELRFYRVSQAAQPALVRRYRGDTTSARRWAHTFANEVLGVLTGLPGAFGTEIAYARRVGPGRKDVFRAEMDGHGERRVSGGAGISLLPAFGNRRIWFTRMTTRGMFLTHGRARDARIITGDGMNMAPAVCDGRVYFTSSRDGNPDIYSAATDGSDVRRLTRHPAMDLSPACAPGDRLAFVSTRHRSPQIFMMKRDGSEVQRVTFRGSHNQTPAVCADPERPLLAFSGRDRGFDIFTLNLETHEYRRLTQGQGQNKDPAFSPDCRLVAFASDRRGEPGVYLASPLGYNQTRVVEGDAETVRWRQWTRFPARASTTSPATPPSPSAPPAP